MKLRRIKIGPIETENNVFLAPLAGYTNYPFRRLCERYGAGLTFTEMVSAKGLKYGSENTKELLYTTPLETPRAAQLFGREPDVMRAACESEALAPFPVVDINMGCPVPKIYKNGEGSAPAYRERNWWQRNLRGAWRARAQAFSPFTAERGINTIRARWITGRSPRRKGR